MAAAQMQAQQMAQYQAYMQQLAAAQQQQAQAGGAQPAAQAPGQPQQQQAATQQQQMAAYQQQLAAYQQQQQMMQQQQQQQMQGQTAQAAQAQQAAQAAQLQATQQQQQQAQQAAQQQLVAQQYAAQQQQAAQPQGAQQQPAAAGGSVGREPNIEITGCAHATVGPIIRGSFVLSGENHGKPTYTKDTQANGLDVMIYFWDERDGVGFSGWWFGPKVGGDQVWAYHTDKVVAGPPTTGWKVPYDGPVDASMAIQAKKSPQQQQLEQAQAQAKQQQQAQGGWGQQQQQQKGGWGQQQQQQQQQGKGAAAWGQQANAQAAQGNSQTEQMRLQQQKMQLEQLKLREEQKSRLDENRKKLEEVKQQRMAQQQAKMEEMKKQQESLVRVRQEEMEKRQAQVAAQRNEQEAVLKIRRCMQKFKASSFDKYEEHKTEFDEIMKAELDNCGSQKDRILVECEQAVEATSTRMVAEQEKKKADEEKKAAEKARRKELKDKAEALLVDLSKLIEVAETATKAVSEEAEPLNGDKPMKADAINACFAAVQEAIMEANKKMSACSEFVLKETPNIRDIPPIEGEPVSTCPQDLAKYLGRLTEFRKSVTAVAGSSMVAKNAGLKKAAATLEHEKHMAVFAKYDLDKDGKLSRKEIQNYAKGEVKFAISAEALDKISSALVADGSKGVAKEDFHRVRAAVGIARELVADAKLREKREEKEKALVKAKEQLKESADEAKVSVEATEQEIQKLEAKLSPAEIGKTMTMTSVEMSTVCDEVDAAATAAKDSQQATKNKVAALTEGVDAQLKGFIDMEVRKLEQLSKSFDSRLSRSCATAARIRSEAVKKNSTELEGLRATVIDMLKHHQSSKGLDNAALFSAVSKNGKVMESDLGRFLKSCDKKEAENGDKKELSAEDLTRVFEYIEEGEEGQLSEAQFLNLIRVFMKVAKATVITEEMDIKSTTMRRLDIGEVVEFLEGPKKLDEESSVERAKIKAMSDGVEGWVAAVGDQGTVFLERGGNIFKVVKETILTSSFEIGGDKDETRKLKDSTQKLKVGEVVEVREWAKKQEDSGLMRMKVRVKSDGQVGWATSVGNTGIVFLEVV